MTKTTVIDRAGITISALCLVHCIGLPILASLSPVLGLLAENESVHKALVLLAIIPAALSFVPNRAYKFTPLISSFGFFGVVALLVSAFFEPLHDYETVLTVIGASALSAAHLIRLMNNVPHHHEN